MASNLFARWRRFQEDRSGLAMVELALVTPLLATMLLGLVDGSLWIISKMSVERAAQAGAEYAVLHGYNSPSISSAVTSATINRSGYMSAISANPAPSKWCGCPSATAVTPATCGTSCSNGLKAGEYVTANAQSNYSFVVPWPGITNPVTISASSSVRIK